MGRVREIHRLRRRVRVGAPDPSVTSFSGMAAVTELVDRLGMIRRADPHPPPQPVDLTYSAHPMGALPPVMIKPW